MKLISQQYRKPIELAVFDLDDTLYSEWEFVRSGLGHIADLTTTSSAISRDEVFDFLWNVTLDRRGDTFDRLLDRFPEIRSLWSIGELVRAYRSHPPDIRLYPGVRELLKQLREGNIRLGIITDGPPDAQRGKLSALHLAEIVEATVITDEFGIDQRKPSTFAFMRFGELFGVDPRACIYIGDNPAKDFVAGRALGWETLRLRMKGQIHETEEAASPEFEPNVEVASITALRSYLQGRIGLQRIGVSQ